MQSVHCVLKHVRTAYSSVHKERDFELLRLGLILADNRTAFEVPREARIYKCLAKACRYALKLSSSSAAKTTVSIC
jgi:hypothetical protein